MELACKLGDQNGVDTDVAVTDFVGFLERREQAYKFAQLRKDPTFETCRCIRATDVALVKEKILAKFPDITAFNAIIKNVADVIL
jgi:beta-lactamase class D